MDCSICCETFNKSTNSPINCQTCTEDTKACQACARRYILESDEPCCMICKIDWDVEFLTSAFTKKFINTELKRHRENVLFEKQLAKMPETQEYAQNMLMVEGLQKQWDLLNVERQKIQAQLHNIKAQQKDLEQSIRTIRHSNRDNPDGKSKVFTMKCPIDNCTGFLDDKYICGICDKKICRHCMEIKDEEHECDSDKKETVALIKKDTKPCPKCGQLIHKIDGCDQMWCPGCKTPFSWNTGKIETGMVHNPEYYRWMRESGQVLERNPLDQPYDPCQNMMPNYMQFLTRVRVYFPVSKSEYTNRMIDSIQTVKMSNIHRVINHIEHLRRQEIHREDTMEMQLRELRAQYLLKKIDKAMLSKKLQAFEKNNNKIKKNQNIWNLLYIQLQEYIGKMMYNYKSIEEGKEEIDKVLTEANKIRLFVNKSFKRIGKMFNMVYPGINSEWIHVHNWEQYLKDKNKSKVINVN